MLRSIIAASLAAGLALSSTAHAAAPESALGHGDTTCAEMLKLSKDVPGSEGIFIGWVQGFMANLNLERIAEGKEPVNLHHSAMPLAIQRDTIRAWCANNPRENVAKAAVLFYASTQLQQSAAMLSKLMREAR